MAAESGTTPASSVARTAPTRKATLVILAWNGWHLTERTLTTLRRTRLANAEVIVVDNGSTDETPARLAEHADWLRVLRLPENVGFVRGNNAGIAAAAPDSDIVLLNNDLRFSDPDWLEKLRAAAAAPRAGIVGCRLLNAEGLLVHTGTFILPDTFWGQQHDGPAEIDIGQFPGNREVQGIVFAVAYIKREVIDAIGPLDLAFQTYFEDTDYCLRAREAGFATIVCGSLTIDHLEHGSTSGNDELRERLFFKGQEIFKKRWRKRLESAYTRDLLWQSIINLPGGYAVTSRALMRKLDMKGVRVAYEYVYGPGTPFPFPEPENSGEYRLNVIRSRKLPDPSASVVYAQADVFLKARGRTRIGYTMLEVDGFPAEWVRQANEMDEVWVPTRFNRDGFLASGLKRPIEVMPLGFDPDYFHPGIASYPNPNGEYIFLSNFEWGERKNPWLLLRTFSRTFSAAEPVRLVVKVNNRAAHIDVAAEIRALDLKDSGGRISYIFNREFPYYQLGAFYRSADCFISAGNGEGWDMPLMEAMACGRPAIATDWGAHRDFVHDGIAYPLAVRGTVPAVAKCPYYEGFRWADPDPDHLRHLLRHIYENREEAAERGAAAASEMHRLWTWDHAAERVLGRLNALGLHPAPLSSA